jgi:hypothetical protein
MIPIKNNANLDMSDRPHDRIHCEDKGNDTRCNILVSGGTKVGSRLILKTLLQTMHDKSWPAIVVNEAGQPIGYITHERLAAVLSTKVEC